MKSNWSLVRELPVHAPTNAVYGRPTGWRSFLGGSVWEWADELGRYLGESNAVPANMCGESTKKGDLQSPGDVVMSPRELLMGEIQRSYAHATYWANQDHRPVLVYGEGRTYGQTIQDSRVAAVLQLLKEEETAIGR